MMNEESIASILEFWFADRQTGAMDEPQSRRWFGSDDSLDQTIRERFENLILAAARGELEHWRESADGVLALVLLFDQFPRNIWRGSAEAFAFGERALELTHFGIERGDPETLGLIKTVFLYMPLEHDESAASQALSLKLFRELEQQAPPELAEFATSTREFAEKHAEIIQRFGRYPHRNRALGRRSTAAEEQWLEGGGTRFGQ